MAGFSVKRAENLSSMYVEKMFSNGSNSLIKDKNQYACEVKGHCIGIWERDCRGVFSVVRRALVSPSSFNDMSSTFHGQGGTSYEFNTVSSPR